MRTCRCACGLHRGQNAAASVPSGKVTDGVRSPVFAFAAPRHSGRDPAGASGRSARRRAKTRTGCRTPARLRESLRLARGGFSLSSGFKSYERLMVCQRAASGLPDYGSAPATVGRWSSRRERPVGVVSAVKANRVRRLAPMPPLVARMAGAFAGIALTVGVQRRRGQHNYVGCPVDVRRVQIARAVPSTTCTCASKLASARTTYTCTGRSQQAQQPKIGFLLQISRESRHCL